MLKLLSIKKTAEFQTISKEGVKFGSHTILLLKNPTPKIYFFDKNCGKNAESFCRVGFTCSKAIGNAVVRNFAKRRLREAARKLLPLHAKQENDYVLIARREIASATYEKILQDLEFCLKKIK